MKEIIRELLEIIFLDYKKSFCLNELYKNGYQYLLYINDSEHNFMRSIDLIDSFTPNKNNKKMRLITLFSFLQNIRDEIEIKTEENNSLNIIKEINFLKPEFFALPEFCIYYFENQIDYTERETKIMSIYNFIECLMYEIQLNKKKLERKKCFLKYIISIGDFIFIYYIYEIINIVLFICENVLLAIEYRKSRNESEEKYNEIDNKKNFRSIEIFAIIHIIFNSIIIIHWLIFRAKIDLFYSITKYTNENLKEEDKLKIRDKAKLLKKEDFSVLDFFTIKIRRESQKN